MTTVETAVGEFLLSCEADQLRPATIKWYRSILTAMQQHIDGDVTTITPSELRQYIADLRNRDARYLDEKQKPKQSGGLSDSAIASYVTGLHAFWGWASREYDFSNPMRNIRRPKISPSTPKAISSADFIKLYKATGDDLQGIRDRAILTFLADTGARLSGVATLTRDNLDIKHQRAMVMEKGNKRRLVVYTNYTRRALERWLYFNESSDPHVFVNMRSGEGLTPNGIYHVIKRLKKRAGVTGRVNPHSFRHRFAREYLRQGGDLVTLAKLLGHSDVKTTADFYSIFTPDELADIHDKFSPLNPVKWDLE